MSDGRTILAIDAGNTRIKAAVFEGDEICHTFAVETDAIEGYAYAKLLAKEMAQKPDGVILASVVRGVAEVLRVAVNEALEIDVCVADPDDPIGIQVGVPDPGSVGIDRLLISGEAFSRTGQATVAVGAGTAITVDLVSANGIYLGGTISPGLRTSFWALAERASLLPEVDLECPITENVPDSTLSAILAGVLLGTAGSIDRLVTELSTRAGFREYSVILTGGDGHKLSEFLNTEHTIVDDLVLRALAKTYGRLVAGR